MHLIMVGRSGEIRSLDGMQHLRFVYYTTFLILHLAALLVTCQLFSSHSYNTKHTASSYFSSVHYAIRAAFARVMNLYPIEDYVRSILQAVNAATNFNASSTPLAQSNLNNCTASED